MAVGPLGGVMQQLRRVVFGPDGGDLSDGQLLQLFIDGQDQAAFAALVRRHGPMVLGVCRRVLNHTQDAEDAFQATFLVLVRKASSIVPRDLVGNWLYGVAYRTAKKARSGQWRTQSGEVPDMPQPEPSTDALWHDLQPLLDEELDRLPDKYRVPVVLCDLEGKTRKEAAGQLGWPEGTLSWRLASAREMLAKRLARRGLALSTASLALVLAQNASASVPAPLVVSTVQAAALSAVGQAVAAGLISAKVAALTEGVLRTMWLNQLKITLAVTAALGILGTGAGMVTYQSFADDAARGRAANNNAEQRRGQEQQRDNADAARREVRKAYSHQGRVGAIANDGKTITLESGGRGEDVKKVDVKITDSTKIEFAGLLKDLYKTLKVGDHVGVHLADGSKDTAGSIDANRPAEVSGKILAVSADGKSLTVQAPPRNRGEEAKAEIKLVDSTKKGTGRRRDGTPEEQTLKVGHFASVWLQEGSKDTAAAVQISPPRPDIYGDITTISADGKEITIETKGRGGDIIKNQVKITDATAIEVAGSDSKKLKVGQSISVLLQEGSKDTAASVQASPARPQGGRAPDVSGRISAVAADGKSFTVEVQRRGEASTSTEIKLGDKTSVEVTGTDKPDDKVLAVGYTVTVWLQEGSKDTAIEVHASKAKERRRE